ncbi:DJ-1/PfpI family protein [Reyranella sp. CPCC 100927]|uniref:DJ-1/PfpI family protein n=1 Tax=Reyranella sp. CPCC 100927 TaxID=2599616 RepID=UPI0011B3AE01|nr:DJ-1/PfpI family protein [Reyranella sp. CPCC 100927]TWT12688.1 DJ-1/PfpI family protein [Reyranella sp. CPCC 100927]
MEIVFLFYDGMTTLDAIGPWEVLSRVPGVLGRVASPAGGRVTTDTGLVFEQCAAIADIARADVLLVPGASDVRPLLRDARVLDWVRAIDATTQWTTSVCTGALVLGAARLLRDKRATTHWAVLDSLRKHGATPVTARIVEDGKTITAAGVSAGIDMALALAARLTDAATAEAVQLVIEYDPQPPFDCGHPAKSTMPTLVRARALLSAPPTGVPS